MKIKLLLSLFGFAFLAFILSSSSGGRATSANSGNTGAPDETTVCGNCHSANAFSPSLSIEVFDAGTTNNVTEYTPETTYDVLVTVNATTGTPAGFGFQIVSLLSSGNTPVNTWANPASNVQIATLGTGRQYAEHNGVTTTNTFSMQWTAPTMGSGEVTFYSAGNAVNGNGGNDGDGADKTSLVLAEAVAASAASNVSASDIANNGNGSDVQVSFDKGADESTIGAYRIMVVKAASASSFDLAAAQAVASGNYTAITPDNSATYASTLAMTANDTDGDAIGNGNTYQVFVLSIADGTNASLDALSPASADLIVENTTNTSDLSTLGGQLYITPSFVLVEFPTTLASKDLAITIFSINGQRIHHQFILNPQTTIDITPLNHGAYFVVLQDKTQRWVKKFVR